MTLATLIDFSDFGVLIESAFQQSETPQVSSSESELGASLQHFADAQAVVAKARQVAETGAHDYAFGLWYPSMKGLVYERRVVLDPPREGHAFRHSLSGWGIVHLHLYFTTGKTLQCRVVVNSEARAKAREARYPELGPVSDWNWRVVEAQAFRLTRKLASMGRTAPVAQLEAPAAAEAEVTAPANPVAADTPAQPARASPWGQGRRR